MRIKLNTDLGGFKAGRTIPIKDIDGVAVDVFWRRRIKDAERDNCVSVVESVTKTKTKSKSKTTDDNAIKVDE